MQTEREAAEASSYLNSFGVFDRGMTLRTSMLGAGHAVVTDSGDVLAVSEVGAARLTVTSMAIGTCAYTRPKQPAGSGHGDAGTDIHD